MTVTALPAALPAAAAGIWAGQRLAPGDPMFNTAEYVDLVGPLDVAAFTAALRDTVEEAETLHARYGVDEPTFTLRAPEWDLSAVDLRGAADPYAAALAWMAADVQRPVDLAAGPPFRQALLRVAGDRHLWFQLIHHIAADGYSFALLGRRVAAHYTARVAGGPVDAGALRPLAAVLDDEARYAERSLADRDFWLGRCADLPVPPTLTDRPAAARGGALRQAVPLPAGLRAAAGPGWTDLATAALAGHIAAHTDADEVVLGLPVAGRLGTPALRVPCMWMNIVPLRVPVARDAGLAGIAAEVAAEVRAVRRHSRYRYEQLRRDLGLVGGDRRLFGPVVNVLPFDHTLRFAGLTATSHNVSAGPVEDLALVLHERGGIPTAELEANPDCYSGEELVAHAAALAELLAEPDRPPRRVRWLDSGPLPTPLPPVTDLIRGHAATTPDQPAVISADGDLNYGELHRAARGLAGRLVAAGAGPDRPVVVALPRGSQAVVAILGVLYAGAAYLPVDPDGPDARTALILADAAPELVVTSARYASLAAGRTRIDPADAAPADLPDCTPDQAAYIIYTSGSTGRPNGVVVEHGALAHFVAGATARYAITAADRVLQFAPLHFDASVEELFLTLCAGATLVLRTDDMMDLGALAAGCAAHRVTVLDLPTAYWHELAYALAAGTVTLPSELHTVIIGGEAALPARVAQWRAAAPGVRLLNTYGPTEATVVATVADLHRAADGTVPIGAPLPGVRAAVVGGELYLAGGGLARGYLNRPERTAQRFVLLDGVRAYRTGDRAHRRADGQLGFTGRVDDEVKISGHRVDPVEIESVLLGHPTVRDAAVVAVTGPAGTRLVAHVVPADAPVDPAALRAHCAAALPGPLIPGTILPIDAVPRTGTGKVDRAALRDRAGDAPAAPGVASGLARTVAQVWADVLGVRPGPDDDFFALGGQSLQTVQVSTRLAAALGRDVPVALVFRHPTVAALAAALDPGAGPATDGDAHLRDAVLPVDIVPGPTRTGPARSIVLTGATGYVGRHVLAELLAATSAVIVCPVRAADTAEATERLRRLLPDGTPASRVRAVAADLGRPRLGLDEAAFAALAEEADVVYHCAAQVSVARDYSSMRAVNVAGTREAVRLAATGRASVLHHVSTVAVLPPGGPADFVDAHPGLRDGYQRSKWAAEQLVAEAGRRGLPVHVWRLGRVTAPTAGGAVNRDDLVWRLLRAAVDVGAVPDLDLMEPWTPADEVARAMVTGGETARVVNLLPDRPVRITDVFDRLQALGHRLAVLPAARWAGAVAGGEHAALADIVVAAAEHRLAGPAPQIDGRHRFTPVDQTLIDRYLHTAVADGVIPPHRTGQEKPT
ncbi:MAG TPA: amino acid adenylation domain-containing protein [Micromonosporaceae bacterium]|nr:amino acid adenylation domain-containing protein [Micromonosporaceae bacterium]